MGDVSIHAPSQERRPTIVLQKTITDGFNPRSLTGATVTTATSLKLMLFQSTLPRGSDKLKLPCTMLPIVFQSTLPCGSDAFCFDTLACKAEISIHAPLRERLSAANVGKKFKIISIHAPLRERPGNICPHITYRIKFQSTLPCGSDQSGFQPAYF